MDFSVASSPNPIITISEAENIFRTYYPQLLNNSNSGHEGTLFVSTLGSERDTNFYVKVIFGDVSGNGNDMKQECEMEQRKDEYVFKFTNSSEPHIETELQTLTLLHLKEILSSTSSSSTSPSSTPTSTSFPSSFSTSLHHQTQQTLRIPEPILSSLTSQYDNPMTLPSDNRITVVRLLTFLPGVTYRTRITTKPSTSQLRYNLGVSLASLDRSLRGFSHPRSANRLLYWDISHADQLNCLLIHISDTELRSRLSSHLTHFKNTTQPQLKRLRIQTIFNDCNPDNIIISNALSDEVSGVIDFGDMIQGGTLSVEVAVAAAYLFFSCDDTEVEDPISDVCDLISGYVSVLPLEVDEITLLFDLIQIRFVITILIANWRAVLHSHNQTYVLRWAVKSLRELNRLQSFDREIVNMKFLSAAFSSFSSFSSFSPLSPFTPPICSTETLLQRREASLAPSYRLFYEKPIQLVRGKGCELYDEFGRVYYDFYNNVVSVGHCHPTVLHSTIHQLTQLNTHTRYLHTTIVDLAQTITQSLPSPLTQCYFTCSGSEANDLAFRLAKCYGNLPPNANAGVLCSEFAYHGGTDVTAAFTPSYGGEHIPLTTQKIDFISLLTTENDPQKPCKAIIDAVTSMKSRDVYPIMLILDCGLTSDGVYPITSGLLRSIILACRECHILFVADEVQIGFARSGGRSLWGFENLLSRNNTEIEYELYVPDIVTMGKPMANGFPMGCVVTRPEISQSFAKVTKYFNTFGGNPVAATACLSVFNVIHTENLSEHTHNMATYFVDKLTQIQHENPQLIREIRHIGLMIGVTVCNSVTASRIVNQLKNRGFLLSTAGSQGDNLKIRPPLVIQKNHINLFCDTLSLSFW
jgi:4-aminobutyrate aminotransferase-like enzyme/Ser/Thr protein kinase RdoA (MazF antagonist)